VVQASLGKKSKTQRTYFQNIQIKKGWRCGSGGKVPALQSLNHEFKPSTTSPPAKKVIAGFFNQEKVRSNRMKSYLKHFIS
jgi:hypothetical protein